MRVYIDANTIISVGSTIVAFGTILGVIFAVYRWYLKQNNQVKEIKEIKEEQCLMIYGLLSCLDGLKQLGANGNVTEAHDKIEKHINKSAHAVD